MARRDGVLVVAGPWHDMDHARLELLTLMAEHEGLRVRVAEGYAPAMLDTADLLVTYTCDVMPDDAGLDALERFLARGGRWFALHATNARLVLEQGAPVRCPPLPPRLRAMLGSQFAAHPAPARFKVSTAAPDHPLVAGVGAFFVEDELYLQDVDTGATVLLTCAFTGRTPLFARADWDEPAHPVMSLRDHGPGGVLYLTLGHTRGRHDMRPLTDAYPFVERGSWPHPVFRDLLRRGLLWAMRAAPYA
ncbi:MAG: ThuA domain-containing protein [Gemmobacter sp.]